MIADRAYASQLEPQRSSVMTLKLLSVLHPCPAQMRVKTLTNLDKPCMIGIGAGEDVEAVMARLQAQAAENTLLKEKQAKASSDLQVSHTLRLALNHSSGHHNTNRPIEPSATTLSQCVWYRTILHEQCKNYLDQGQKLVLMLPWHCQTS